MKNSQILGNKLSVVIPVYNEEENIGNTVNSIASELSKNGTDWEMILVDDASNDNTPEILQRLKDKFSEVRVFRNERNRKLGYTLRRGFREAKGDVIFYTDCDLPCLPEKISYALRIIEVYNADVVSAYRFDRSSEGFLRFVYSKTYNLIIRILFGLEVRDVNFACKFIKRKVLDTIKLISDGSFIDAEILIKAKRNGFTILQFGTDYFPRLRGKSTLANFSIIFKIFKEMFKCRVKLWRGK